MDVGCELGGCMDDEAPGITESPAIFDSTLIDGNIFLSACSHLARADNGILFYV